MATLTPLDPALFGDSPARDARFVVKDHWEECANFPDESPQKLLEFFHRQMNEEMNGMENAAQSLADFSEADWDIRMWMARQCSDEARHVLMFRQIFEKRGGRVGEYPVLNFQFRIISNISHLIGRLAVQNRSFEAEGIDAVSFAIEQARERGDSELAELFEAQQADEVVHVRFANDWIREQLRKEPRLALRMAAALTAASKAFAQVMGESGAEVVKYLVDEQVRLEAGFEPAEVKAVAESVNPKRLANREAKKSRAPSAGS